MVRSSCSPKILSGLFWNFGRLRRHLGRALGGFTRDVLGARRVAERAPGRHRLAGLGGWERAPPGPCRPRGQLAGAGFVDEWDAFSDFLRNLRRPACTRPDARSGTPPEPTSLIDYFHQWRSPPAMAITTSSVASLAFRAGQARRTPSSRIDDISEPLLNSEPGAYRTLRTRACPSPKRPLRKTRSKWLILFGAG